MPAMTAQPIKVFGLLAFHDKQKPLIDKHCFGDCGKVSMAGVIMDDTLGGFWVCSHEPCPWLEKQMDEPYGTTMSFGQPHEVYLRVLTDTPTSPCGDEPLAAVAEPFSIKHYSADERPIIKGNGFDGLEIGRNRDEAMEFVAFVNALITKAGA